MFWIVVVCGVASCCLLNFVIVARLFHFYLIFIVIFNLIEVVCVCPQYLFVLSTFVPYYHHRPSKNPHKWLNLLYQNVKTGKNCLKCQRLDRGSIAGQLWGSRYCTKGRGSFHGPGLLLGLFMGVTMVFHSPWSWERLVTAYNMDFLTSVHNQRWIYQITPTQIIIAPIQTYDKDCILGVFAPIDICWSH